MFDRSTLIKSVAGAAAAATLILPGLALAQTQLFNSHAFLQAPDVEVGVRPNGAFGSTVMPAGFNGNSGSCLGFITSRNSDGWGLGSQVDGDFFCPGVPYEGWSLSVDGASAHNSNSTTDVSGTLGSLVVGPPVHSVTWTSDAPFNGIAVSQTYSVDEANLRLDISVTLTNTTGATINGVRYARLVDPDNATQPGMDIYTSTQLIVGQGAAAQVRASFTNGALIALTSTDPRATAAYQNGGAQTADAIVTGTGWATAIGATATEDTNIGLAVDVGSMAAGASETFNISYPLTAAAVAPPAPPPVPTLSEWALILLGLMMAGAAAVMLQRRQARA